MTFGEKIKTARREEGLSQEQFAKKMNISRSAVAKWETDKGLPDIDNLKVIALLLNVSVDYLLNSDEELSFDDSNENNVGILLPILTTAIFGFHCIMSAMGKIPFFFVIITAAFIWFFYIVMSISFAISIKNDDYTIIAGYKKGKESTTMTKKKLIVVNYLSGFMALTCEFIFTGTYLLPEKMIICLMISGLYLLSVLLITLIVKYKYNN